MEELIKTELFKNIDSFINEIDLTMDYIESDIISNIRKYVNVIRENPDDFKVFIKYTNDHLNQFEPQISAILFSNKKIKSGYYNFLNDIILFNNLLQCKLFENEGKNTKKSIIKYIYAIYMSSVFLIQENNDSDILSDKLTNFISKIQEEAMNALKEQDIKNDIKNTNKNKTKKVSNTNSQINNNISLPNLSNLPNLDGLDDITGVMNSILGNKEILNIATDISNKMQSQQINPMTMLSSLMSGNIENSPLQSLVEEIQQKVDDKINTGEINKEMLENQAQTLMNNIGSKQNVLNSMPGMADIIKNMVKDI